MLLTRRGKNLRSPGWNVKNSAYALELCSCIDQRTRGFQPVEKDDVIPCLRC